MALGIPKVVYRIANAGLRFDTKEGAFAALGEYKDHYAIVPKDIENSTLIHRINTED